MNFFELDGVDLKESFRIFVHAPFKDHADGERNDCSIALQIRLEVEGAQSHLMLLGDHCYPTVKRIFECSDDDDLKWNVFVGPHHCSKSVMYWRDPGSEHATLRQEVLDLIEGAAQNPGYIIASSEPIPGANQKGDNPPHAKAKARYEEIVPTGFFCTQEHIDEEQPQPIVFEATQRWPGLCATQGEFESRSLDFSRRRGSARTGCSRTSCGSRGLRSGIVTKGQRTAWEQLVEIAAAPAVRWRLSVQPRLILVCS